jgi:hypothetical protein
MMFGGDQEQTPTTETTEGWAGADQSYAPTNYVRSYDEGRPRK